MTKSPSMNKDVLMEGLEELKSVAAFVYPAMEAGLLAEVVLFALLAMKRDPSLTAAEAARIGHDEWIK
jgi:hypothetical protein